MSRRANNLKKRLRIEAERLPAVRRAEAEVRQQKAHIESEMEYLRNMLAMTATVYRNPHSDHYHVGVDFQPDVLMQRMYHHRDPQKAAMNMSALVRSMAREAAYKMERAILAELPKRMFGVPV